MRSLFLLTLLTSCASFQESSEVSDGAIINLATTSYIKGCVDGKNDIYKIKTKGRRFERCKEMSKEHRKDITEILKKGPE